MPNQKLDVESVPHRLVALELVAASFIVLFQELTLIRWLPVQVRVLAYFPNLILISAFLGLGLGCLRTGCRPLLWLWPSSLLVLVAAGLGMSGIAFTNNSPSVYLWLLYYDLDPDSWVIRDIRFPIVLTFVLSMLSFVPLGQFVAERIQRFRSLAIPLLGYSYDIAGSLLGVVIFAVVCFLNTGPVLWFAIFIVAGQIFLLKGKPFSAAYLAAGVIMLLAIAIMDQGVRYSPYYAISQGSKKFSQLAVLTNGSLHQFAFPTARGSPLKPVWENARRGYHLPYRLLKNSPKRVLILGAGTGNDVAVALDEGAERVEAVEIDPVILEIGKEYHPNQPYASQKVHATVTDARSFLNDSQEEYDLIVFGTLDSMVRLSALSNVRLDNFVYTLEGLRAARARLAPKGGIVMYFMVKESYIHSRLSAMLEETFGQPPRVVKNPSFLVFNSIYMAGPAFSNGLVRGKRVSNPSVDGKSRTIEMPSDDWPFLYLRERSINKFYLSLMSIFCLVAVIGALIASKEMRASFARKGGFDGEMFCFGFGFLLLETKSITQLNLLWGATWLTSAVVFGSVLIMVLLATLLMQVRPMKWRVAITGLVLSLIISYGIPTNVGLVYSVAWRLGFSLLVVGLPIFFASVCFALVFAIRENADLAFGWNLLGAVAGGLLEFLSLATGLRALSLVALCAYMIAVFIQVRKENPPPELRAAT